MICLVWFLASVAPLPAAELVSFAPTAKLNNSESRDQDDMSVWIHPRQRDKSTIIASDKSAGRIFVYDLAGKVLQSLIVPKPGNIDIRQGVLLDGHATDVVVVNQRTEGFKLLVFRVDPETRQLERIDDHCATLPNYGGCLFHSSKNGKLYFFCTSEDGTVEQLELTGNGRQRVNAKQVRTLMIGKCEGAVADDEAGAVYVSEEKKGVWKFDAEPHMPSTGTLIAAVGENGLQGDIEGLALSKAANGDGYLLVSDQGRNRFVAYQRQSPNMRIGEFQIEGASQTDGIEVCAANLGINFPEGFFACHTDASPRWVLLTPWNQIARQLSDTAAATESAK